MTTCASFRPELLPYHLGACEPALRDAVDAHLTRCGACLSMFLAQKRACEDGAAFQERPSPRAHQRLRDAVARRRPRARRTVWMVGLAAAAAVVLGLAWAWWAPGEEPLREPNAAGLVDAASVQNLSQFL